jgi:hypothetical protein
MIEFIIGYAVSRVLGGIELAPAQYYYEEPRTEIQAPHVWSCRHGRCTHRTYDFYDLQRHFVLEHPQSGMGQELIQAGHLTNGEPPPRRSKSSTKPSRWQRLCTAFRRSLFS